MPKIGIIDDDRTVRVLIESAFADSKNETFLAENASEGIAMVKTSALDVLLLDINLPDKSGLEICQEIQTIDRRLPIIFITSDESGDAVIEAMKLGAYDFIAKPIDISRLKNVVDQALQTRRRMNVEVALSPEPSQDTGKDALIGRSPAMIEVFRAIAQCAAQNVSTLVRGESGTGKELVARAIYQHSERSKAPFLAVNCAALHEGLLESELFGHEKGSFSGATARRIGKFEQCDGGTIFLDEVGDMSLSVQSKVLRLLQQQEFQRLGGSETITTDVRIISATNRPLEEMCDSGEFRLDLFHRLNGFAINIPPLRERGNDVKTLVEHFIASATNKLNLNNFEGVAPKALELLIKYDWPGNVRELETVLHQSLMGLSGPVLVEDYLPDSIRYGLSASATKAQAGAPQGLDALIRSGLKVPGDVYATIIAQVEQRLLELVLIETDGNQSQAAEILGITRGKLRNRIRTFEIDVESIGEGSSD